ncbi:uncharacterized protein VTP21DRAFT_420 [Calcarisporiella thermophila]|uniref:uncharacterized protein n=1 Tax=Calcarisporiella thermophila TaxID=911321 RepID=UPI0037443B38
MKSSTPVDRCIMGINSIASNLKEMEGLLRNMTAIDHQIDSLNMHSKMPATPGALLRLKLRNYSDLYCLLHGSQWADQDASNFHRAHPTPHPVRKDVIALLNCADALYKLSSASQCEISAMMESQGLRDYLLHVYDSACFHFHQIPNRSQLLKDNNSENDLTASAIAWAAIHVFLYHQDTIYGEKLLVLGESLYTTAKCRIQKMFDEPSEVQVLAAFNLCAYLFQLSRYNECYHQLSMTLIMARAINLEHGYGQQDVGKLGTLSRRRLWEALQRFELYLIHIYPLPQLIYPKGNPPYPPVLPDSREDKETKAAFLHNVRLHQFARELSYLPEIDLSAPDNKIFSSLVEIISTIRRHFPQNFRYTEKDECSTINNGSDSILVVHIWMAWMQVFASFLDDIEIFQDICCAPRPATISPSLLVRQLKAIAILEMLNAAQRGVY